MKQNTKESLFKNPFADYNANVVDPKTILDYWCSPFSINENLAGLNESSVFEEKNPIVLMGGRGSGKTMFLRFWSYSIQKELHLENVGKQDLLNEIIHSGGLASYIRIDGPALRSFEGFDVSPKIWDVVFTHYFELIVGRSFVVSINDLVKEGVLSNEKSTELSSELSRLLGLPKPFYSLESIIRHIENEIEEVTNYRAQVAIFEAEFKPTKVLVSKSLSFGVPKLIRTTFPEFSTPFNFIILIDEYENFLECQQRMINSLMKFSEPGITFRLGMRLEGFRTYDTINSDDFIKEGRDYQQYVFEELLNISSGGYQDYLAEIARKRLESVPFFKEIGLINIRDVLGEKEDLLQEVNELVAKQRYRHFDHFSKLIPSNAKELIVSDNPIIELLALVRIARGEDIKKVGQAVTDFNNQIASEGSKKLKYDYANKYRLSLTILFNSIHHKNKLYYSFNTYSYLSSGTIGHFMELCRKCFQYAEFEGKDSLVKKGVISKEIQTKAAIDIATRELQMVRRIEDHGGRIYRLTENIGNIFRTYHVDDYVRYPETNQFSLDKELLEEPYSSAFNTALKWSILQQKKRLQHSSPGKGRTQIYTLNRIFSPIFQLTYRTRGGINEEYNSINIIELMDSANVPPKRNLVRKKKGGKTSSSQQTLDL